MKPTEFVAALKSETRSGVKHEMHYLAKPPTRDPPAHLARFSTWFKQLSPSDKKVVREFALFVAEGSLFRLLTYLDNTVSLTGKEGKFELWHISRSGKRELLNDPEGDLLNEVFDQIE